MVSARCCFGLLCVKGGKLGVLAVSGVAGRWGLHGLGWRGDVRGRSPIFAV